MPSKRRSMESPSMETVLQRMLQWSLREMDWYRFSYRREKDPLGPFF
ncbi:MAG: hypothetical protein ACE5OY_05315 [Candidatus Bathyarchaeia archaeon]